MWIRYNPAAKYYEKSDNNGASWSQLPMSANSITEGTFPPSVVPPIDTTYIAYKNQTNTFTVDQRISTSYYPSLVFRDDDAPFDTKDWWIRHDGTYLVFQKVNDANSVIQSQPLLLAPDGSISVGLSATIGQDLTANRNIRAINNLKVDCNLFCGAQGTVGAPGDMSVSQASGTIGTLYFGTDGGSYHHRNGPVQYYMSSGGYHYFYQGIRSAGYCYMAGLALGADVTPFAVGDLVLARNGASNIGTIYFGSGQGSYIYFDGSQMHYGGIPRVNINGHLVVSGNIHSVGGWLYPSYENSTINTSHYFSGHTYYGLFTNSQLYVTGYVWTVGIINHASTLAERKALRAKVEQLPDRDSWVIQGVRFGDARDDPTAATLGPASGFIHAKDEDDNDIRIPYWR